MINSHEFSKMFLDVLKESYIEWIKNFQENNGSWGNVRHTGFALWILSKAGVKRTDSWINRNGILLSIDDGIDYIIKSHKYWDDRIWDNSIIILGLLENGISIKEKIINEGIQAIKEEIAKTNYPHWAAMSLLIFDKIGEKKLVNDIIDEFQNGKFVPNNDGNWRNDPYDTAIILYCLINSGISLNNIIIRKGIAWLKNISKIKPDMYGTKKISPSILAFVKIEHTLEDKFIDDVLDEFLKRTKIDELGASLKSNIDYTLYGCWMLCELRIILDNSKLQLPNSIFLKYNNIIVRVLHSGLGSLDEKIKVLDNRITELKKDNDIIDRLENGKYTLVKNLSYNLLRLGSFLFVALLILITIIQRTKLKPYVDVISIIGGAIAVITFLYIILKKEN